MKPYRIAAIPGDGIGTEVVSAGIEVLLAGEAKTSDVTAAVIDAIYGANA